MKLRHGEKKTLLKKAEKAQIQRQWCGKEGGLEWDMVKKKKTATLIVKYEIVLRQGRYWVRM